MWHSLVVVRSKLTKMQKIKDGNVMSQVPVGVYASFRFPPEQTQSLSSHPWIYPICNATILGIILLKTANVFKTVTYIPTAMLLLANDKAEHLIIIQYH